MRRLVGSAHDAVAVRQCVAYVRALAAADRVDMAEVQFDESRQQTWKVRAICVLESPGHDVWRSDADYTGSRVYQSATVRLRCR